MGGSLRQNASMSTLQDGSDHHSYLHLVFRTLLCVAEGRPYVWGLCTATVVTIWVFSYARVQNPISKLPLVTPKGFWDMGGRKARQSFMSNARAVVENGFEQVR